MPEVELNGWRLCHEEAGAERLAAGLPAVIEFVRVPAAGHPSTVENPQRVTPAIERFLERVWPPA